MTKHNFASDRFDESQPNYAETGLKKGRFYHHQQKYNEALEEFDKAIAFKQNFLDRYFQA